MRCEYCDQPTPRVILRGDLVQNKLTGRTGIVLSIIDGGRMVSVAIIGARSFGLKMWNTRGVDLIHGTIHVTERL